MTDFTGPARWSGRQSGKRVVHVDLPIGDQSAPAADAQIEFGADPEIDSEYEIDATDAARALAAQHNVDLAQLKGTGNYGRITKDDVQQHIDADTALADTV